MFVILDSTEFFDAPQADSNSFKILEEFIRRTRSRLVIPEVVFKETLNHVRETLERLPREIKSMQRQYERVKTAGCEELVVTQPDFARALELYEVAFRRRLERSFQAVFLPLAATHESVLDRALRRQRPFLQNKDGYRDTLIWLSIKTRIVEQPGEYLFVTNNSKDFSDKELVVELGNLAQGTSLQFENDLKGFINNHAKDALERLNTVRTKLQRALQLPGIDLKEAHSAPRSDDLRSMSNKLRLRGYQYRKIEEPYHIDDFSEPE
ncbi:MAG: PIN domain-containing protein, partial [Candidatus Angelobacter sp.]